MKRHAFTIGAVLAVFTLSQAPAFGQAGSRPNTTGSSTGSAAPRGGDPGGGSSAGSSSAGSSSMGSSSGSGTATSRPSGGDGGGMSSAPRERAPQRPMAVPRSASSSDAGTAMRPEGAGTRLSPAEQGARAVPAYSRPRDGRAPLGAAINRADAPPPPGGGTSIIYYPYSYYGYYSPWGYGYPGYGYGYGFGYFGYDPFLFGGGYYTTPSYSAGGYSQQQRGTGNLRLRVKPAEAQVYVDGYYVGIVNDFNGLFQRLNIDAGAHRIELRADGYEPVEFEVFVQPGETVTYRGEMKPRIP